jgi:hypothetical protein
MIAWMLVLAAADPSLHFTDKDGVHDVVFTFTDSRRAPTKTTEGTHSRTMTVNHVVSATADAASRKTVWSAKDFVLDCEFDLDLRVLDGSLQVTDLDKDGTSEVSFGYIATCQSDVSPSTMKWLMYEGATKYAVRGTTRVVIDDKGTTAGGDNQFDPAASSWSKAFAAFADTQWKKLTGT